MTAFLAQIEFLDSSLVRQFALGKLHPEVDQFFDARGAFLNDRADDGLFAQASASPEGVAHMQFEGILLTGDCGDAALGVIGVRLGAIFLGDDADATALRHFQRERQPSNPTAEDQVIELFYGHHLQPRIIYQTSFSNEHRQRHVRSRTHFIQRLQGGWIEKLDVIDLRGGLTLDKRV